KVASIGTSGGFLDERWDENMPAPDFDLGVGGSAAGAAEADVAAENAALFDLTRDTPHRREDGTAFLPMATQRIFSMQWEIAHRKQVPLASEMTGRIVTDPGTGTIVQAQLAGVIQANDGQFPYIGMHVR